MKKETRMALAGAGHEILMGLAWAGAIMLLAMGAWFAQGQGYIDRDATLRIVAMNGLWLAWFGNRVPKAIAPHPIARKVARFSGWSFVLSGLIYAGLWAFAPIPVAVTVGTGAMVAGVVLALGHCFWLVTRPQAGA